jgi:hypothetical protein
MLQATPTSPWQPTSAPLIEAFLQECQLQQRGVSKVDSAFKRKPGKSRFC